jgi:hypothetical protein
MSFIWHAVNPKCQVVAGVRTVTTYRIGAVAPKSHRACSLIQFIKPVAQAKAHLLQTQKMGFLQMMPKGGTVGFLI